MTTAVDRRRDGRAVPVANWRIRNAQRISEAADWFGRSLYTKALLGVLLCTAIAITCWTMLVQLETANGYNDAIQREVSLRLALDDMQATVLRLQYQHLEDRIDDAERKLIPDYGTLATWLHELQAAGAARAVDVTYTVNEEQRMESRPGLLAVPLVLTVQARPDSQAQVFGEGLTLLRQLSEVRWAGELVAAYGESEGRGLTRMNFEYRVWMRTRDGFDNAPGATPDDSEDGAADAPPSLVSAQGAVEGTPP